MSWFYVLLEITLMVGIDLLFLAALVLLVIPLGMFRQTAFAVLKRNFAGYFSNPTGYAFLCLFVLLTSGCAFWPPGFFASNLANFDQLNKYLPIVMLVYVPAITMSIWSEEKRQGTDELLLTLPTTDFDIVLGKYFAAVFVFTVALLYSQLCNYIVLVLLTNANLDVGLLSVTYLGYWFVGISMIAIGMVASFLSNNLTIAFLFGVLFNAPLALLSFSDTIVGRSSISVVAREWSLLAMFETFGRGLVGLAPVIYFLAIIVFGLYLCLVLIGRRHWNSGRNDGWMWLHYIVRAWTLVVILVGAVVLIDNSSLRRVRVDLSESQVSTLSPETREILRDLASGRGAGGEAPPPIVIEAFIADEVPTEYVQTRYELINLLQEFDVLGGDRIRVRLRTGVKPYSEEAVTAEERYDIFPVSVRTRTQGRNITEPLIMGASFTCGLERVTVPFFDYGMPVEYELIRSISTVAQEQRKTIGVLDTNVNLAGVTVGEDGVQRQSDSLLSELQKQYDLRLVDPEFPISIWEESEEDGKTKKKLRYDALLVAQPSTLTAQGMSNLMEAIKQGQPTVIFEDPASIMRMTLNTSTPRGQTPERIKQGLPVPPPKGDMRQLWELLQLQVSGQFDRTQTFQPDIVWQSYTPYQQDELLRDSPEFVVIRNDMPEAEEPFNEESEVTRGLEELMAPYPGAIRPTELAEKLEIFEPLVSTGKAGVIRFDKLSAQTVREINEPRRSVASLRGNPIGSYTLAARIKGTLPESAFDVGEGRTRTPGQPADLDVIYIADLDLVAPQFVSLRNQPNAGEITYRMQNLTFALNAIDVVVGDLRYVPIRRRTRTYRTLTAMEEQIEEARAEVLVARQEYEKEFDEARERAQLEMQKAIKPYREMTEAMEKARQANQPIDQQAYRVKKLFENQAIQNQQEKMQNKVAQLSRERDEKIRQIERKTDLAIVQKQNEIKFNALWIPVVPPLLLSLGVFTMRRLRERAGISKQRLR